MKNGNINLVDLDFEYKMWKHRLTLFVQEIDILKNRNEEVKAEKYFEELNTVELMVLDEHVDQLNKLLNRIKVQENEMQYYNKDFPITVEHKYFKEHEKLRAHMVNISKVHLARVADLTNALGI